METGKPIKTFAINLKRRTDRKAHIAEQFSGKDEFNLHIVEAFEHEKGARGLWNTITHIIKDLTDNTEDDYIIICEDDHTFTNNYSAKALHEAISKGQQLSADILCGGISWFDNAIQITPGIFLIETIFNGAQFTIIFKKFYKCILKAIFTEQDVADIKLSCLSDRILFMFPFISIQTEFGYSDATSFNNIKGRVDNLFSLSSSGIQVIKDITQLYAGKRTGTAYTPDYSHDHIVLPTYIINLPENAERKKHILKQFRDKPEFDITIIEGCKGKSGKMGLWLSIRKIIEIAIKNDDDVIVICKDNHEFTEHYSKNLLFTTVLQAHALGAGCLTFGTTQFGFCVPITHHLFWTNRYSYFQFIVIYKPIFEKILNENFNEDVDPDHLLSEVTSNKMIVYPFISKHLEFEIFDIDKKRGDDNKGPQFMYNNSIKRLTNITNKYSDYIPFMEYV